MGHQRRWLLKTASLPLDRATKNTTKYPDNTRQVGFCGVGMTGSHTQNEQQVSVYNEQAECISNRYFNPLITTSLFGTSGFAH